MDVPQAYNCFFLIFAVLFNYFNFRHYSSDFLFLNLKIIDHSPAFCRTSPPVHG